MYTPDIKQRIEAQDYFEFLGKKISEKDINSNLPFFQCEINGHKEQSLDHVCLDSNCKSKGLTCPRCVYYRHSEHVYKCIPLNKFISELLRS